MTYKVDRNGYHANTPHRHFILGDHVKHVVSGDIGIVVSLELNNNYVKEYLVSTGIGFNHWCKPVELELVK